MRRSGRTRLRERGYAAAMIFHASTNRLIGGEKNRFLRVSSLSFPPEVLHSLRCVARFISVSFHSYSVTIQRRNMTDTHIHALSSTIIACWNSITNENLIDPPLNFYWQYLLNVWTGTLWFHFESRLYIQGVACSCEFCLWISKCREFN